MKNAFASSLVPKLETWSVGVKPLRRDCDRFHICVCPSGLWNIIVRQCVNTNIYIVETGQSPESCFMWSFRWRSCYRNSQGLVDLFFSKTVVNQRTSNTLTCFSSLLLSLMLWAPRFSFNGLLDLTSCHCYLDLAFDAIVIFRGCSS